MNRARAAKVSLVLVSLSGRAGSEDLGRRGGPVQVLEMVYSALMEGILPGDVDRRRSNGSRSAGLLVEKWPPRPKVELG